MAKEIERKFLIADSKLALKDAKQNATKILQIEQGYLCKGPTTIRIRITNDNAVITVKGPRKNLTCDEYEYTIPALDAREMMDRYALASVTKTRYVFWVESSEYELDVFHGNLRDNMLAEIELTSQDACFSKPKWLGQEVSSDKRYSNANLAFKGWPKR